MDRGVAHLVGDHITQSTKANLQSLRSVAKWHGRKVSVLNWHDCTLPGMNIEEPEDCRPYDPNDNRRRNRKRDLIKLINRAITKIHRKDYDLSILYWDSLKNTAGSAATGIAAQVLSHKTSKQ